MGTQKDPQLDKVDSENKRIRAIIHKKILEEAKNEPEASLTEIAESVSGASETLVERVLEEYGDPAEKPDQDQAQQSEESPNQQVEQPGDAVDDEIEMSSEKTAPAGSISENGSVSNSPAIASITNESGGASAERTESETATSSTSAGIQLGTKTQVPVEPSELSNKQWEALRAIKENPTDTQKEIADRLDVSRATVSKRVNKISSFNWKTRRPFVDQLFDNISDEQDESPEEELPQTDVAELASQVAELENRVDQMETAAAFNPELAHKIIHACMDAEYISEEQERHLLRQII